MSQNEPPNPPESSSTPLSDSPAPEHFTRQPWWLVPLGGLVAALLPLFKYGKFQQKVPGIGLAEAMATAGCLGLLGAGVLVARSHIRSVGWANTVLWGGMVLAALGFSILSVMLPS